MKFANRVDKLPAYFFVEISKTIASKKAQGVDVITFGIGDPDLPTPQNILDKLWEQAKIPSNHRYPETDGLPEYRQAISDWYKRRFNVDLDRDKEVLPVIGSKEGIGHIALCFIDPGDIALIPDPGYPTYSMGTIFAGGECYWMPLLEKNGYLPDLSSIPSNIAKKAKVMWLNYPNNPTGAVADINYFNEVIEFGKQFDIAVLHDAAYSEVAFDGYKPISIMQAKDAKDIAVEFHSLSKSYNMTGWRIGMAVGNAEIIDALMRVKSNMDSGIPQAIQYAAIEALNGSQDCIIEHNKIYQERRDKIVNVLEKIGLEVNPCYASLFVWVKIPKGYTSGQFAELMLNDLDIVVTPGLGYGEYGEGYIRLSLTLPDDQLDRGLKRISEWTIPSQ
jgi:LL-diaminopimelate aminotransferase